MWRQYLIVGVMVAVAVALVGWRIFRGLTGKGGCGCCGRPCDLRDKTEAGDTPDEGDNAAQPR